MQLMTDIMKRIEKIKKLYDNNVLVEEYYIETESIDQKQLEYEKELSNTNDIEEIKEVTNNILNLYKTDDNIRLIGLN